MTRHPLPSLLGLALNFESGAVPGWVQLTPPGPVVQGRDGRTFRLSDPAAVAAAYDPAKEPQIDLEHSSQIAAPLGMPAPAVGWIKQIEVRDGALWGRVEWNAEGERAIASRAYRYLSPVLKVEVQSGEIRQIVSAGLTNTPNLFLAALNAKAAQQENNPMDAAVLQALGLQPTATAAEAVLAINALREAHTTALNAARVPDPALFVPRADHELALNRISTFEAAETARREAEIVAAVDAAVAAGQVAPASRDYHLASCRAEGGLERFRTFTASAPAIVTPAATPTTPPGPAAPALTADELAICRMFGTTPTAFAAAKAKLQEH